MDRAYFRIMGLGDIVEDVPGEILEDVPEKADNKSQVESPKPHPSPPQADDGKILCNYMLVGDFPIIIL